ncbi:MAG: TetR/AcrR family transcriptional regulator, partial [Clostridia bacterium]|nr:TetR/AcrR family transcriptional regulator [Clostridia bacterium]
MPPKVKITKEDIVKTALELVRAEGEEALNARSIAAALGCSTQPIFSNFETMDELREAGAESAYELYLGFIENEVKAGK